jgi:hypothetical protein
MFIYHIAPQSAFSERCQLVWGFMPTTLQSSRPTLTSPEFVSASLFIMPQVACIQNKQYHFFRFLFLGFRPESSLPEKTHSPGTSPFCHPRMSSLSYVK